MSKKKFTPPLLSEQHQAALEEYEKGVRLLQQKDYSKAIPRFQAVLEQYPKEAVLGDRARAYLRIASNESAERRPLTSTKDAAQCFEVGVYLLNSGQFKEATRHLERAAEHQPKDAGVHVTLAAAQLHAGERASCLASLARAMDLDPSVRFRIKSMSDFDELAGEDSFGAQSLG